MKYTIAAIAVTGLGIALAPAAGAAPCTQDTAGTWTCSGSGFSANFTPGEGRWGSATYGGSSNGSGFQIGGDESSVTIAGRTFSTADNPLNTGG